MSVNQYLCLDLSNIVMNAVNSIVTNHLLPVFKNWTNAMQRFDCRDFAELEENCEDIQRYSRSFNQFETESKEVDEQIVKISDYCLCGPQTHNSQREDSSQIADIADIANYQSLDTYKKLSKVVKLDHPNATKEEIYEELLKPYRHEKVKEWDDSLNRYKISYICRYEGCDKCFVKTWNLLDHMRMHEGIKPYSCQLWGKTYTQKGNLK